MVVWLVAPVTMGHLEVVKVKQLAKQELEFQVLFGGRAFFPQGRNELFRLLLWIFPRLLLQAAGIALPKKISGIGQLNYWKSNKPNPTRCLFWGTTQTRGAVRCGNLKYYTDGGVMYDVVHDISEARDLSKSNPTMTAKLIKVLKTWQSKLPPPNYQTSPGGGEG